MSTITPENRGEKWVLFISTSPSGKFWPLLWIAFAMIWGYEFFKHENVFNAVVAISWLWLAFISFERRYFVNIIRRQQAIIKENANNKGGRDVEATSDVVG